MLCLWCLEPVDHHEEHPVKGTMRGLRGILYLIARLLGDLNAVLKNRIARRAGRRAAGKATGGLFRKLFK